AIEAEVVTLCSDVGLWHAEALRGTRTLTFLTVTLLPAHKNVRQIVLRMFLWTECSLRHNAELLIIQQRRAFVIERPAVRLHIIEPNVVRAARVGLGEQQNRS